MTTDAVSTETAAYEPLRPPGHLVASFRKNTYERCDVTLQAHEGKHYIDIRVLTRDGNNNFRPTRKGITLRSDCYPELARAMVAVGRLLGYPDGVVP